MDKELMRQEPTLRATLEELERAYFPAKEHFEALDKKRNELLEQLEAIEQAKSQTEPAYGSFPTPEVEPEHEPEPEESHDDDTDVVADEELPGEPDE